MHLVTRNVNSAFRLLVKMFEGSTVDGVMAHSPSRAGPVLQMLEPITLTYLCPLERVLFNAARDANPFFHLYEALWMLAGRNDVGPLAYYNSRMREFSDNGSTFNGAYGYRWRRLGDVEQLEEIACHLRENPSSRRAVLQMWTVEDDLLRIDNSRDVCCNTCVYFALRDKVLDMTVCNRSNDLIWGMLGTNVVHFSILQEYLAAKIGVGVGLYNQFSNNLHVYTDRFTPDKWLQEPDIEYPQGRIPLVANSVNFDRECEMIVERHQRDAMADEYTEPFLQWVAQPMFIAFHYYKRREWSHARGACDGIEDAAWKAAALGWIRRRIHKDLYPDEDKPGYDPDFAV